MTITWMCISEQSRSIDTAVVLNMCRPLDNPLCLHGLMHAQECDYIVYYTNSHVCVHLVTRVYKLLSFSNRWLNPWSMLLLIIQLYLSFLSVRVTFNISDRIVNINIKFLVNWSFLFLPVSTSHFMRQRSQVLQVINHNRNTVKMKNLITNSNSETKFIEQTFEFEESRLFTNKNKHNIA